MSNTSKIILVTIIASLILLGLGYAAIQNITLNISGTASANTDDANFNVRFTRVVDVSDSTLITASKTDDTNAKIVVSGLTEKGQRATATYEILNDSADLSSDLNVATTNSNTEYFYISSELAKSSIKAKETTTVLVTVELLKTPIGDPVNTNIGVSLTGIPVQPGEEGSSGLANDFSETPEPMTLAAVTTENIGDYIDLRNDVIKTTSTKDDWRILYKDDTAVYAVLADYLPNSTNYAANAGLETMGEYGVYSNISGDDLHTALKTTSNWNHLANGINGAEVFGTMETTIIKDSYRVKGYGYLNTDGTTTWNQNYIDLTVEDSDLYVSNTDIVKDCLGTWTFSLSKDTVHHIFYDGMIEIKFETDVYPNAYYDNSYMAIRPMVKLPLDTVVIKTGEIWSISLDETNGRTDAGVERNQPIETIQTTLENVSKENIGEYIDLGNSYVGGESTCDDWRILYNDGNTIYVILSDMLALEYIPIETTTLTCNSEINKYGVWGDNKKAQEIVDGLLHSTEWDFLTNGVSGAEAQGGPSTQLLLNSYNWKKSVKLSLSDDVQLEMNHLYSQPIRKTEDVYWTTTLGTSTSVWAMRNGARLSKFSNTNTTVGVRPIVMLPATTSCTYTDGLWVVE